MQVSLGCNAVYNGKAEQNRNRAKTHTSAQTTFLLTGTAVSTFLRLLRCVARATFLHRHNGLCNFLSRSFVTFRYFCAPARRTTMARRDTVKTHTSAQTALLSTGTAISTFLRLLRCVAHATFLHWQNGLCNFVSRSFVTFCYFCAPTRRTTMATRTTLKTHTSAQIALLSTGTAV